jgi:hypothetical protein
MTQIKVGNRVAYSATWLKATGNHTGRIPFARGRVVEIVEMTDMRLARVDWNDHCVPDKVCTANLVVIGSTEWNRGE